MKKIAVLLVITVLGIISAEAGGSHGRHHHHWHGRSHLSFYVGAYPYCPPVYSYWSYPRYTYVYPGYSYGLPVYYSSYSQRPNYAVGGTFLGALAGGIIGHSLDRRGWEGAGIGAATGLVLGSIAERNTRAQERAYEAQPVTYAPRATEVRSAPRVPDAPRVPEAPRIQNTGSASANAMSSANSLFGR